MSKAKPVVEERKTYQPTTTFETFRPIDSYQAQEWKQNSHYCWNRVCAYRKYRITVELLEEPIEVLRARVRDLFSQCKNHHDYPVLEQAAREVGIDLWETGKSAEIVF